VPFLVHPVNINTGALNSSLAVSRSGVSRTKSQINSYANLQNTDCYCWLLGTCCCFFQNDFIYVFFETRAMYCSEQKPTTRSFRRTP